MSAPPASAATAFPKVGEIAGPGSGHFGALKSESVAVNDKNGHVYVADSSNGTVYEFESPTDTTGEVFSGAAFGTGTVAIAVDESSGDVYVADSTDKVVKEFTAAGTLIRTIDGSTTPAKSFESPSPGGTSGSFGIAVDQGSGDLYVIDAGHEVIDAFDPTGKYLRQITAAPTGLYTCGHEFADGIAVDEASGEVLVSDSCEDKAFRFSLAGAYEGELSGAATPAGSFAGYVSVAAANASGRIYVLDSAHQVIDAFNPDGTYSGSQIVGEPTGGPDGGLAVDQANGHAYVADNATGTVSIFNPVIVPDVATLAATEVELESATLNGTLDPDSEGQATCQFRWGTTRQLEHTAPCEPETVAEGSTAVPVHAKLTGLETGITYFYRLEATNKNGTNVGSTDETHEFTTGGPHVYGEAVSDIGSTTATLEAQIDPNGLPTTYRFEFLTEAQFNADGGSFAGAAVVPVPDGTVPTAPVGTGTGTLRAGSRQVEPLGVSSGSLPVGDTITGAGIPAGTIIREIIEGGETLVLSNPVAESGAAVTVTAPPQVSQPLSGLLPGARYLYRVVATNPATPPGGVAGPTQLLVTYPSALEAALPDGRAFELVSPGLKTAGGGVLLSENGFTPSGFLATEDGSAITYPGEGFFEPPNATFPDGYTSFRGPDGWTTRNTTGQDLAESFAPLAPPAVPPAPVLPPSASPTAKIVEETPDGSVVFFTDTGKLTSDSTAAPGEPDLYRYEVASGSLTDLSVDPHPGEHADVQGLVAVGGEGAEAGSYVYFVADGVLASGAAVGDCSPSVPEPGHVASGTTPGTSCNLYLNHGGSITLLAALSAEDNLKRRELGPPKEREVEPHDWLEESGPSNAGFSTAGYGTAEASPSGRYLAFSAVESLTPQPAPFTGPQVFRYDAATATLLCASCETNGSQSPGASLSFTGEFGRHPHYIADDGRVLFNDRGALSPRDQNATTDVYEFEDTGTGTCGDPVGCQSLISAGAGAGKSYLVAASTEGSDIFFTSNQELTSEDGDTSLDVYDARIGGRPPPVPPEPCETGESCHGKATVPAPEQSPGTAGFHGAGNPTEKACKKGFVKHGAKCVKKPSKHHKHNSHHKKSHKGHKKNKRAASHKRGGGK